MQALTRPRRSPLVMTVVVLAVLCGLFLAAAAFITEYLWFQAIGSTPVFTTQMVTRVALFLVGALILGGMVAADLLLAWRLRPQA